jgi:hypothetical protein
MNGIITAPDQKVYMLVKINNEQHLACRLNGEWVTDSVCKKVNELLQEGIVSPDTVTDWIMLHKTEGMLH